MSWEIENVLFLMFLVGTSLLYATAANMSSGEGMGDTQQGGKAGQMQGTKLGILAPWLGLILILAIGGGMFALRRRRAH